MTNAYVKKWPNTLSQIYFGCLAYAVGCAAYAVGCTAYAVGCAAYIHTVRIKITKSS